MANPAALYRPWQINGTYFSRMLQCGGGGNAWLEYALIHCLPIEIFDEWKERLMYLSTANSDAFRIAKATRESRELIFISERIIPKSGLSEDDPSVCYFVFVALHELVHAIKQHKPPNEISEEENNAQEAEADELAFNWYNAYVGRLKNPYLKEYTKAELDEAKKKNIEVMQAAQS